MVSIGGHFLHVVLVTIVFGANARVQDQVRVEEKYCPYFKNRAPSPQPDLQNCTWYKANSCCLPKELGIILDEIAPLTGANQKCLRYLNYLMCYVCAPDQNSFYRNERLTVCREFCEQLYSACTGALLKGMKISSAYSSGKEFCESRKFAVKAKSSKQCFVYDASIQSSGSTIKVSMLFSVLAAWLMYTASVV